MSKQNLHQTQLFLDDAKVETLYRNGHHHGSNSLLSRNSKLEHASLAKHDDELRRSSHYLIRAKNCFHLGSMSEVQALLGAIPAAVMRTSKFISAEAYALNGLVERRKAHRMLKLANTSVEDAVSTAALAIEYFRSSMYECSIAGGVLDRVALNAQLNETYTHGLIALIKGVPHEQTLLISSVETVDAIRQASAPKERDGLTEMMIVADLASGIGVHPNELEDLSEKIAYKAALLKTIDTRLTWTGNLLACIEADTHRPWVLARALILACKLRCEADIHLLKKLLIRALDALLRLQVESQKETQLTRLLRFYGQAISDQIGHNPTRRIFR